ncbi:MAG: hypothetical protein ABFD92_10870 [Planctomycetaceae bacterium]|nr:hypothetical protein [Planctomycetaceae bacterium]
MFVLRWTPQALSQFNALQDQAQKVVRSRRKSGRGKSSKQEGLFKQVVKTLQLLASNPRHPGLATHAYECLSHPYRAGDKVFEAYAQNRTSGAYRIFWCYGPDKGQITIIAITPHP